MSKGIGRPSLTVTERYGKKSLKDVMADYNYGKQMYLLALQRGIEASEAVKIAKRYGIDIVNFLIEPEFQGVSEYFRKNKWPSVEEVDELWEKIRARHFIDRLFDDAEKQLDKSDHMDRDKTSTRVAAQYAIMVMGKDKKDSGDEVGRSYDEIILKRHLEYGQVDNGTDKHIPGGAGAGD